MRQFLNSRVINELRRESEGILRKHTDGSHPNDFQMFLELHRGGKYVITPLPGVATHGQTDWLCPLTDWELISNSNHSLLSK